MKKVLVLLSGGIDSSLCLALAIKKYGKKNVKTISFNYGQKNVKELDACQAIANHYDVENKIVDISNLFEYESCSLLQKSSKSIPTETYEEQYAKTGTTSTNVPYRNGVMLTICASVAIAEKLDIIYYGIHIEEGIGANLYPDCSQEFNLAINLAIYIGSGKLVQIEAPLVGMHKNEIIKLARDNKLPFEKTWTCYNDFPYSCGKCRACADRIKGFSDNGLVDPLKYEV